MEHAPAVAVPPVHEGEAEQATVAMDALLASGDGHAAEPAGGADE